MWYKWFWQSGLVTICKGYSKTEMQVMERKEGKLISKQVY